MRARNIIAIAACVLTFALHAALVPAQGLTDDDDFYAPAAIRYAEWIGDAFTSPTRAFTRHAIDAAWKHNREHPPLAKVAMGFTHAIFHGPFRSLDAARLGTSLFAALLSLTLVLMLWRPLGAPAAIAAPILLLSLPRFVFHSQVATLDVPVACAVVVVTAAFFHADRKRTTRAELLCGVLFGLALLVKLNAPFAILPCALWTLASRWRGFSIDGLSLRLPPIPPALFFMALLGPLLFVVLWPWLWFDTAKRLGEYFAFHLAHYPIYLFYDGVIWEKPFAPWHAPFVLGFGSMPAPIVALGLYGAVRATRALARLLKNADAEGHAAHVDDGDRLRALLLLQAMFAIGIVAFLPVPKYGGEKLFMPFFPLWCALAADGAAILARRYAAFVIVIALAIAPGIHGSVKHHGGFALSYYGELVGGLRGAVARGYERTYYDVADKDLARWLDQNAQRVHFEPNHKEYVRTYRWLRRDGVIGRVHTSDERDADVIVLTHERRWRTYPALLERYSKYPVVYEKRIDGVPLYTVYRNTRR